MHEKYCQNNHQGDIEDVDEDQDAEIASFISMVPVHFHEHLCLGERIIIEVIL